MAEEGLGCAEDAGAVAYLQFLRSEVALFEGRLDEAERLGAEISQLVERGALGSFGDVARGAVVLTPAYRGDGSASTTLAEQMQSRAELAGADLVIAWARYLRGEALLDTHPAMAARQLQAALAGAGRNGDRYLAGVALVSAATVHSRHGELSEALAMFADVINHWHRSGDWTHQWTTMRNVVDLLVRLGRDDDAAVLLAAIVSRTTAADVFGDDAVRMAASRELLLQRLGTAAVASAHKRGVALGDDQVVAHACGAIHAASTVGVTDGAGRTARNRSPRAAGR